MTPTFTHSLHQSFTSPHLHALKPAFTHSLHQSFTRRRLRALKPSLTHSLHHSLYFGSPRKTSLTKWGRRRPKGRRRRRRRPFGVRRSAFGVDSRPLAFGVRRSQSLLTVVVDSAVCECRPWVSSIVSLLTTSLRCDSDAGRDVDTVAARGQVISVVVALRPLASTKQSSSMSRASASFGEEGERFGTENFVGKRKNNTIPVVSRIVPSRLLAPLLT